MDFISDNNYAVLFGSKENFTFIYNQILPELDNVIDEKIIFSDDNLNDKTRLNNYNKILSVANNLLKDDAYANFLRSYDKKPIELLIKAYVFIKIKLNEKNDDINVFTDKRSVVYTGFDYNDI